MIPDKSISMFYKLIYFPKVDVDTETNAEEDEVGELALWTSDARVIELHKGSEGLGFSILDYLVLSNLYTFLTMDKKYNNYIFFENKF